MAITNPTDVTNCTQDIRNPIVSCKTYIQTINLSCKLASNIQFLEVGKKTLVDFIVEGDRGSEEIVSYEVVPDGVFELTTKSWIAKAKTAILGENWHLRTHITAKKIGEATLQFKINGKNINTIKLTTKVNSDKDVFAQMAVSRLVDEMLYVRPFVESIPPPSEYRENYCMAAAERGLSELLQDTVNFYSIERGTHTRKNGVGFYDSAKRKQLGSADRAEKFSSLGFVKNILEVTSYKIDHTKRAEINKSSSYKEAKAVFGNVLYSIVTLSAEAKEKIYNQFIVNLDNKVGYHVYYFSVTGGFHTLLLVIDYRSPCQATYAVYDQHGKSSSAGDLKEIGEGLRRQTSWTFANACLNRFSTGKTQHFDPVGTKLWKIQRKNG